MGAPNRNTITLKGSTKTVTEFFGYAVNSILYQRGIYPPESFQVQKRYGLSLMVTAEEALTKYLTDVLTQMSDWLLAGQLQKMVMVVTSCVSRQVLERWTFDILTDPTAIAAADGAERPEKEVVAEIQAIIRQITASVTFLPLLQDRCSFDLLVYADAESTVPGTWEDSDAKLIQNASDVKLRSFATKVHKVETLVSYREDDAENSSIAANS